MCLEGFTVINETFFICENALFAGGSVYKTRYQINSTGFLLAPISGSYKNNMYMPVARSFSFRTFGTESLSFRDVFQLYRS